MRTPRSVVGGQRGLGLAQRCAFEQFDLRAALAAQPPGQPVLPGRCRRRGGARTGRASHAPAPGCRLRRPAPGGARQRAAVQRLHRIGDALHLRSMLAAAAAATATAGCCGSEPRAAPTGLLPSNSMRGSCRASPGRPMGTTACAARMPALPNEQPWPGSSRSTTVTCRPRRAARWRSRCRRCRRRRRRRVRCSSVVSTRPEIRRPRPKAAPWLPAATPGHAPAKRSAASSEWPCRVDRILPTLGCAHVPASCGLSSPHGDMTCRTRYPPRSRPCPALCWRSLAFVQWRWRRN